MVVTRVQARRELEDETSKERKSYFLGLKSQRLIEVSLHDVTVSMYPVLHVLPFGRGFYELIFDKCT